MKFFDKKLIGLLIGLIFIVLILNNIDINKSIEAVKSINPFYLVLMVPVYYSSFVFRALRWRAILSENKRIKLSSLFNYLMKGWTVNCLVPARAGEIYRAHLAGKKENLSRVTILASIVLERIFDGIILFFILFFLVSFMYSSKKLFGVLTTAGIIFLGGFVFLLVISKFHKAQKWSFLSRFEHLSSFINGLNIFHSPILLLKSFLYTIPIWFCEAVTTMLLIKGFGYSIGMLGSFFVLCIVAFASLIPGGPAALGPLQWGYIMALSFFHISQETAFAISLLSQIFGVTLVSLGSLFFIMLENKILYFCQLKIK